MPAVDYSHNYDEIEIEKEHKHGKKTSKVTSPIKKTKVEKKDNIRVHHKADYKATTVNFVLLTLGGIVALAFVSVYSMVALSETKLSKLHSKISELNYENIELENKLENVKSYYSVDTKVSSASDFDKAKNVIEVDKVVAVPVQHEEPKTNNLNTVTGF